MLEGGREKAGREKRKVIEALGAVLFGWRKRQGRTAGEGLLLVVGRQMEKGRAGGRKETMRGCRRHR